jgi:hypothetical protein
MKASMDTLKKIRIEIYERLIKDVDASVWEFKEDAETWSSRMRDSHRLKSVYDPEEQAHKSLFAVSVYEEIASLLRKAKDD